MFHKHSGLNGDCLLLNTSPLTHAVCSWGCWPTFSCVFKVAGSDKETVVWGPIRACVAISEETLVPTYLRRPGDDAIYHYHSDVLWLFWDWTSQIVCFNKAGALFFGLCKILLRQKTCKESCKRSLHLSLTSNSIEIYAFARCFCTKWLYSSSTFLCMCILCQLNPWSYRC